VVGARALRRDLRRMGFEGAPRMVTAVIRDSVQPLAESARSHAAAFSTQIPPSIRGVAYATSASIRSRLPQSGVWEFGGTIEPKGTPIEIEGQHFVLDAWDDKGSTVQANLERAFGSFARRYGFR
jgi:hypothetical protein